MNQSNDTPVHGQADDVNGTAPAASARRLRGIAMTPPFGRTPEGKLGPVGRQTRKTGEKLVTALWIAHRAARRLRRALKRHRPGRCPRIDLPCCEACGRTPAVACPACDLLRVLAALIGPEATVRLGEAADRAAAVLPYFDVHRRLGEMERHMGELSKRDEEEDSPATPPTPPAAAERPCPAPGVAATPSGVVEPTDP